MFGGADSVDEERVDPTSLQFFAAKRLNSVAAGLPALTRWAVFWRRCAAKDGIIDAGFGATVHLLRKNDP